MRVLIAKCTEKYTVDSRNGPLTTVTLSMEPDGSLTTPRGDFVFIVHDEEDLKVYQVGTRFRLTPELSVSPVSARPKSDPTDAQALELADVVLELDRRIISLDPTENNKSAREALMAHQALAAPFLARWVKSKVEAPWTHWAASWPTPR